MARAASTDTIAAVPKYEALNEVDMRLNEIEHMLIFACDVVEKLSGEEKEGFDADEADRLAFCIWNTLRGVVELRGVLRRTGTTASPSITNRLMRFFRADSAIQG
jgi:hypothetical protein